MKAKTRIAAIQMVSGPDVAQNCETAAHLIEQAVRVGAELVALPEYFPLISEDEFAKVRHRERHGGGPIQDFLAATARRHGIWLVGGSVPLAADDANKVRNACLVFNDQGEEVARYDKIHLFGYAKGGERYDEALSIEAGDGAVAFESPFGRVALGICYDLRFPELFRALGEFDLLVLPAAFTVTTGRAHWEILLRARAIENQCYVLASAQGGLHPSGRRTYGDSIIVDPWGSVLNRLLQGPGVVTAEMDAGVVMETRQNLPALKHRRLPSGGRH